MKLHYFVILSGLLHLTSLFYLKISKTNTHVEIIETELSGTVGRSAPVRAPIAKQKISVPKAGPVKSQITNEPEAANSQTGSKETFGLEPQSAASLTVSPKLVKEVLAPYPKEARWAHVEGDVVLKLIIDEQGKVEQASVINSLGHGLDEAALTAIRQFIFSPGFNDGKVVKTEIKYRYKFRLD